MREVLKWAQRRSIKRINRLRERHLSSSIKQKCKLLKMFNILGLALAEMALNL